MHEAETVGYMQFAEMKKEVKYAEGKYCMMVVEPSIYNRTHVE
jgi:hypothetical protein